MSTYKYFHALLPVCRLRTGEPGISYLQELRSWKIGVLVACAIAVTMALQEVAAGQFEAPDLEGFVLHHERDADGDGDGKNETRIKQYLNANGDSIVSFSSNGQLWAWSLDSDKDEAGTRNYVIRDSNCDGIFDEVYGLDDEFHVPACLK